MHVLLETCEQFICPRLIGSQTLIIVPIRSQLKGGAIREDTCSILICLQDQMVFHTVKTVLLDQWLGVCARACLLTLIRSRIPVFSSDSLGEIWILRLSDKE